MGRAMATAAAASTPVATTCSATSAPAAISAIGDRKIENRGLELCGLIDGKYC